MCRVVKMFEIIQNGLLQLSKTDQEYEEKYRSYLDVNYTLTGEDIDDLFRSLSELLLKPGCSEKIARCFPQIVLQLLTLSKNRKENARRKRDKCISLGRLVRLHPDVIRFSAKYFESCDFPLSAMAEQLRTRTLSNDDNKSIKEMLKSCYNFLLISNEHFRNRKNWSLLLGPFLHHTSPQIIWLTCQCIAAVTGMSDCQRQCFLLKHLPENACNTYTVHYDIRRRTSEKIPQLTAASDGDLPIVSNTVVSVGGIQLPIYDPGQVQASWFLAADEFNLRHIALAVANGKAVCLKGPVGCGKTALVEHLAKLTGRRASHFVKVQLGDQTDSKTLLGTYQCTDVAGEFVWTAGVLTRAVLEGDWLLLEDVDSAAVDVATIVTALLETGELAVPGYREAVRPAPGFQLFLTQRTLGGHGAASALLEKHWVQINLDPLDYGQLVTLVETMFPKLKSVASRMVDVFSTLREPTSESRTVGRLSSTRDLIKWCTRNVETFDITSRDSTLKIFQDALDIFCQNISKPESVLKLAVRIAACLGLTEAQATYYCTAYKPNISRTNTHFTTGRVQTEIAPGFTPASPGVFCLTRPAACLLESVQACVAHNEPALLVGETGTGKTSAVQHLAARVGRRLVAINMNQQSDAADLLGGYKPVDVKHVAYPVREDLEAALRATYPAARVDNLVRNMGICYNQQRWRALCRLMKQVVAVVARDLSDRSDANLELRWTVMADRVDKLEAKLRNAGAMAFAFIEGSLVQALREGWWVLLDEINLASAETLECLSGLLEGSTGSLHMLERGDKAAVARHRNFRLFACMNPATDVGKKELPVGLRNRFTELFVSELTERTDLTQLSGSYLRGLSLSDAKLDHLVTFYLNVRAQALASLADGTGHKPHYSLRSLCRALHIASKNACGSVPRSLYEALCVSFLTQLDHESHPKVERMIAMAVVNKNEAKSILHQPIPEPPTLDGQTHVNFEGYWVPRGRLEPDVSEKYILTACVRRNLRDVARAVSVARRLPLLVQGETAVGKTSLIEYLARASGNPCVRVNNHEHTDLQEYVGAYVADAHGKLVFKEGVLVEAMRKGEWIILDELNLAPSDVLEALNRVLDDNRQLFIPETRETVNAHPNFMVFATQNPPGLYGGRKVLSRAFRNRFIELHFNEIPPAELEVILHQRCHLPPSYCKKLVAVMTELQVRRKGSSAFAGKQGFITLRDLFRWGERYRLANQALAGKLYDWDQHIADEGYLILAGRVRKAEEREVIRDVLQIHIKRSVDPQKLFTLSSESSPVTRAILERLVVAPPPEFRHIVWTYNMRQLAVLVGKALEFQEPVLLVGETGCGKTTVCQLLAANQSQALLSVNCHMHTESADFLGGLRPVRQHAPHENESERRLFEWVDGPLIKAMLDGDLFLADEISLADDSVLERLNSLLEPERRLLLAEKGADTEAIVAHPRFHFIGTMNPGGDYGKKELSPALRNRFTEIWCEPCTERSDLLAVIEHNVRAGLSLGNQQDGTTGIGRCLLDFIQWFTSTDVGKRFTVSVRDILSWVNFINVCTSGDAHRLDVSAAYVHGAFLTFLDALGSGATSTDSASSLKQLRHLALRFLAVQTDEEGIDDAGTSTEVLLTETHFGIHPFYVQRGAAPIAAGGFTFRAATTALNAVRVLRALQLSKPVLLEGSPGVGKTALVEALARASGHTLVRINLSDQTDVCDLFGSDLPVEGGQGGEFSWRDGPFLQALRAGHWILIDELNLASQSVLEGLNACLDHRGEVFVPELGLSFKVQPGTRLFAAQNPLRQGGARRGLPKSFLNRFTQVYMDSLTDSDLSLIAGQLYPEISVDVIGRMVAFSARVARETSALLWGYSGAPWEFNLRDLTRWCQSIVRRGPADNPGRYVELIYIDRMRTKDDKQKVKEIYCEIFGSEYPLRCEFPRIHVTPRNVYIGDVTLARNTGEESATVEPSEVNEVKSESECKGAVESDANYGQFADRDSCVLRAQFRALRSLARCAAMNWLAIVVGPTDAGKTAAVRLLADLAGRELKILSVNAAMDTTEILGGFEQVDYNRHLETVTSTLGRHLVDAVRRLLVTSSGRRDAASDAQSLLAQWEEHRLLASAPDQEGCSGQSVAQSTERFRATAQSLRRLIAAVSAQDGLPDYQLQTLTDQLERLEASVQREGNLNAGGKFEWVDSVLVKCLVEGTWLLIDNVNLCSPAVLDRLNGLLEPNGKLVVGERGVRPDGKLFTVQPHPAFRIFMTMDPKNGEISRAMRNRGIEIYMPATTGLEFPLDARALLAQAGLSGQHQAALVSVHHQLTTLMQGGVGMSHLLRAAFLLNQQIERGFPFHEIFSTTCREIYVRPNVARLANTSQETIEEIVAGALAHPDEKVTLEALVKDSDASFTLSTGLLRENSRYAVVKQSGAAVQALLTSCHTAKMEFVLKAIQISSGENDEPTLDTYVQKFVKVLLLIFYEMSSYDDNELRHEWISEIVGSDQEAASQVLRSSQALCEAVNAFKRGLNRGGRDLPWDLRWLPDVVRDGGESKVNKLHVLLQFNSKLKEVFDEQDSSQMSVLKYSENVLKGMCSGSLTKEPIIVQSSLVVSRLSSCLSAALLSPATDIDLARWSRLHDGLESLFQLFAQFKQPVATDIGRKVAVNEKTLNVLFVHFKWMSKRFLTELEQLMMQDRDLYKSEQMMKLKNTMATVIASIPASSLPLVGIGRRVRKELGQPFPFSTKQHAELALGVKRLCNALDVWSEHEDRLVQKVPALLTNECIEARNKLITAQVILSGEVTDENMFQVLDIISFSEEIFSKLGLLGPPTDEHHQLAMSLTTVQSAFVSARMQLWPLQELMSLIVGGELRRIVLANQAVTFTDLGAIMSELTSVPPTLAAMVRSFEREDLRSKRNVAELTSLLMRHCTMATATRNVGNFGKMDEFAVETIHPLHCPLLATLVVELVIPQDALSPTEVTDKLATLGGHEARKQQLATVLQILWRNMANLTEENFNFNKNDALGAIAAYENLLDCLEAVLGKDDTEVATRTSALIVKMNAFKTTRHADDSIESFTNCLSALESDVATLRETLQAESNMSLVTTTGKVWIGVGFLQMAMFANLGFMDPIAKRQIKMKRALEELEAIRLKLLAYDLQSQVFGKDIDEESNVNTHPFIVEYQKKMTALHERSDHLKKFVAYRPEDAMFTSLAKEAFHFTKSLCSAEVVFGLQRRLVNEMTNDSRTSASVLQEAKNWQESQKRFYAKIEKDYGLFPDLVMPILAASTQLGYGIHLLSSVSHKLLIRKNFSLSPDAQELVSSLVSFPSASLPTLVDNCTSTHMKQLIKNTLAQEHVPQEIFRLVKASLEELRNYVMTSGSFDAQSWQQLTDILCQVVANWREQQQRKAEKQIEEDSMFIKRSATRSENLTDEQQTLVDMKELFPSTVDSDFGDLERFSSLDLATPTSQAADVALPVLSDSDISDVCSLHSELVQAVTKTTWMQPQAPNKHGGLKLDVVQPFMERCRTFGLLVKKLSLGLDNAMDTRLSPSLMTLTSLALDAVDGRTSDIAADSSPARSKPRSRAKYDFYRHARVEEVKQCVPLLDGLTRRVEELLTEWPEHPTLNQITTIVQRIRSFPVSSPVSRFLIGLELLLTKLQEWEENAHKGVSLSLQMQAVTHQIIAWRKLELNVWKDFIAITAEKATINASKWWFHIYALVDEFAATVGTEQRKELIESLKRFVEESPLGEFDARLDLLLSFHCHLSHLQPAPNRDELMNILWNLHCYYGQFSENVNAHIAQLRAPIEKKLRDFVKIARWNDISYWAIKETVDKTHRTLLKHVKEFQNVLKQPVRDALVNPNNEISVVNDGLAPNRSLRHQQNKYYLEPSQYIASAAKEFDSVEWTIESELLGKANAFFSKSRKLCKETILATEYPRLVQTVDNLVGEIIDTANHLKNLEVSKELPKEKQTSQAKSFLQQKRKALADLFKTLQTLGVSYRLGLAEWATDATISDWTVPPVDIKAALGHFKSRRADHQLLSVWDGCEEYFLKLSARVAMLENALKNPSKDLGPPNLERIRGFSIHLMRIIQQQKKEVTKASNSLFELRCQTSQLQMLESSEERLPSQAELRLCEKQLSSALVTVLVTLEQLSVVLSSCPRSGDVDFQVPLLKSVAQTSSINNAIRGDPAWQAVSNQVKNLLSSVKKIKNNVDKAMTLKYTELNDLINKMSTDVLIQPNQFKVLASSFEQLDCVVEELSQLRLVFVSGNSGHPMADSLTSLETLLRSEVTSFRKIVARSDEPMEVEGGNCNDIDIGAFTEDAEKLLQKILFAIQQLYKKYAVSNPEETIHPEPSSVQEENGTDDPIDVVEENHLRGKISESLAADLTDLALDAVNEKLRSLMGTLSRDSSGACKRVLSRCAPCLEQLTLLAQFFVTQQVAAYRVSAKLLSVLLSVFLNLAAKGFCVPTELAAGEAGADQTSGGMGLGEGEGETDVSERIESEDQLEDARPQGEQNKDEDKDCKEEEKGIEMSEDFGGRAQELEEKEREEGDDQESADEEEPDKEMGETDNGADKLDQQIWGDDDDSEPEDEDEENLDGKQENQEKGEGEKDGAAELGAKDDEGNAGEDEQGEANEQEEDDGKKKKKKEINEMQEPELDDDHTDPYHGNHPPEVEPEDLDLPDDLQLDDGEMKDNAEEGEENPFDIDEMKEQMPADTDAPEEDPTDKSEDPSKMADSSDEDEEGGEKKDHEELTEPEEPPNDEDTQAEESGGKMGDEEATEENADEEKAIPSDDLTSADQVQPADEMEVDGSKDQVSGESAEVKSQEQECAEGLQDEQERVGQAQAQDQDSGHRGEASTARDVAANARQREQKKKEKRKKPGQSDSTRSLAETEEPVNKKLKTMDAQKHEEAKDESQEADKDEDVADQADMVQHIKDADKSYDTQALDAATKEQAEKQPVPNLEDEKGDELKEEDDMDLEDDDQQLPDDETPRESSDKLDADSKQSRDKRDATAHDKMDADDMEVTVEGEHVDTMTVERGSETTYHTIFGEMTEPDPSSIQLSAEETLRNMRAELENQLDNWRQAPPTVEAEKAWELFSAVTEDLARNLSEQLRLVLEPTQAARLRGDYRTGRRINMRKVIPYIASHFRKDKIWLRRTKPSKREYQIVLAIDDSSSMADNHSKELAFESLAVVSKALTLLEAGELAVVSFGETSKVLHKLGEPLTQHCGASLLQQFTFEQTQTRVGQLVDFAAAVLAGGSTSRSTERSQLLVIVSDGRGVFSEGADKVRQAVRRAKLAGLFIVFIIVDNPDTKDSILDIRVPTFKDGKVSINSYLDGFPFPFYLILRDINALPAVLSEALRQWFELVTNTDAK